MPKTIFKYQIPLNTKSNILIPKNSTIRAIDTQNGDIFMWIEGTRYDLGKEEDKRLRTFGVFETGSDIPDNSVYLQTIQLYNGNWIGHVYELLNTP